MKKTTFATEIIDFKFYLQFGRILFVRPKYSKAKHFNKLNISNS